MIYQRESLETELRDAMLRALDGDKTSYEKLLTRVTVMLRGYLTNTLSAAQRSEERVEDLVQDVLVAIHRKKHLYRPDMPILPWLFAIARYRLIDHVRAERRRPSLVELDDTIDAVDPKEKADGIEHALELEELMEDLSSKQREILMLAKAEGVPLAEIAERFQMSLSSVKVTVHRALEKVRRKTEPST